MKKKNNLKNVSVLLVAVFMVLSATVVAVNIMPMKKSVVCVLSYRGNTLITEGEEVDCRVIEVDENGTIVWVYDSEYLFWPRDAERLVNGNTLITDGLEDVIEVDNNGTIVWQKTGLDDPRDAERLENGNTLIVETGAARVIEVDYNGTVVWEKYGPGYPMDAERLSNGNTLITTGGSVIEVDYNGTVVWEMIPPNTPMDAERLSNGNTLIAEGNRVIEVDYNGTIVWERTGLHTPDDAERLSNGNTLITVTADYFIIEVDYNGTIVWQYDPEYGPPNDAERVNQQPYQPSDPNPEDGAADVDVNADLSWTCDDPDPGDTLSYDVYFGTDPDPPLEAEDLTDTYYDPGTMDFNTQYYWKIVAWDNHGASTEGPIWSFTTMEFIPVPDLDCDGELNWIDVEPGSEITGTFIVLNAGDPSSELDWDIIEYPGWGIWTFDPDSGDDLTPEHGIVTVDVTVIAPNQENQDYSGEIKIVNRHDLNDFCTIPVSLSTPVNYNQPFLQLLEKIIERFPLLERILLNLI